MQTFEQEVAGNTIGSNFGNSLFNKIFVGEIRTESEVKFQYLINTFVQIMY